MVAYLDLIILENFCMNFLILYTTGKLLSRKLKKLRLIVASIIGDLYTFMLCINVPNYIVNISKIVMAVLLVKICYMSKSLKNIMKESIVFFLVSFIYAGCALGFIYFAKPKVVYIVNGIIIGGEYIFELVLVSSIISFALIKMAMQLIKIKKKLSKSDMICNLKIVNGNKSVKLKALLDTGNLLTEPITKQPVVVTQFNVVKPVISENHLKEIEYLLGGDVFLDNYDYDANIRVIPYVSVGNNSGIMIAYKVDYIKVEYENEINILKDVLIGLYKEPLTKNNRYSALIGLKILEGGKSKNEFDSDIKNKGKYSVC